MEITKTEILLGAGILFRIKTPYFMIQFFGVPKYLISSKMKIVKTQNP